MNGTAQLFDKRNVIESDRNNTWIVMVPGCNFLIQHVLHYAVSTEKNQHDKTLVIFQTRGRSAPSSLIVSD